MLCRVTTFQPEISNGPRTVVDTMGNLFCSDCCAKDGAASGYAAMSTGGEGSTFSSSTGGEFISSIQKEVDPSSSIFNGTFVDQKFTSKTTYEPRFIWVNLDTLTIHMSQHNTKERRHKEASLADVTNVERGAPKRVKSVSDDVNDTVCLTVNFQRGGGIDLKFSSAAECDLWMKVLSKIVAYLKRDKKNI